MEINGEKLLKESDSSIRNEKRKTKTHAGIFKQGIQLFSIFSEEMLINCLIKIFECAKINKDFLFQL